MSNDKKFVVQTRSLENYAAADWNGTGSFPHRWKYELGNEYLVSGVGREPDALAHVAMNHCYSNNVSIQFITRVTPYETWKLELPSEFRTKNLILLQASKGKNVKRFR